MTRRRALKVYLTLLSIVFGIFNPGMVVVLNAQQKPALPRPDSQQDVNSLNARIRAGNKIQVGQPKVYDDTLLRQMLQNAEAKLALMQVLDSSTVAGHLGNISGGSQQIATNAFNFQGPSLPSIATTNNGATGSSGVSNAPGGLTTTQNSALPVQNVLTTQPQANPPISTAPAGTLSLPSSPTVSASDFLNEQMQLTYEIANLRLLLEGSLNDRFDKTGKIVKEKVTLGFPITLDPDKRFKNAVAVVEVVVETSNPRLEAAPSNNGGNSQEAKAAANDEPENTEAPIVTALLPKEKTYNVASITEKGTSIGGGVVTSLVGVSAAFLRARKTFYVVQDQDTLALGFDPDIKDPRRKAVGFLWQFKPVLGQEYVKPGVKQTFVQLAFSKPALAKNFGHVYVRTYWRYFDRKTGLLKDVVPDSVVDTAVTGEIHSYRLVDNPINFSIADLEDIGGGQMLVNVNGDYLSGTRIRVGQTVYSQDSGNLTVGQRKMRFQASIADLATKNVVLVARDGNELPLVMPGESCQHQLSVTGTKISTVDQNNSLVTVTVNDACFFSNSLTEGGSVNAPEPLPPLVFVLGGRVFGYSDAPVQRDKSSLSISAVIPTSLLIANPELQVKSLFKCDSYQTTVDLTGKFGDVKSSQYLLSQTERFVILSQDKQNTTFLLFGNRLKELTILDLAPTQASIREVGNGENSDTLKKVTVQNGQLKILKQLIVQRSGERPFAIPFPPVDIPASTPPPAITADRVAINGDEVTINGSGFLDIDNVTYKNIRLPKPVVSSDGTSMILRGLRGLGVTRDVSPKMLTLNFKEKQVDVKLDVVTYIVETRPK